MKLILGGFNLTASVNLEIVKYFLEFSFGVFWFRFWEVTNFTLGVSLCSWSLGG